MTEEGREPTKRNRVSLLAVGQDDLLVRAPYDFPQARLSGVRDKEVARSICILVAHFGVGDWEGGFRRGLFAPFLMSMRRACLIG